MYVWTKAGMVWRAATSVLELVHGSSTPLWRLYSHCERLADYTLAQWEYNAKMDAYFPPGSHPFGSRWCVGRALPPHALSGAGHGTRGGWRPDRVVVLVSACMWVLVSACMWAQRHTRLVACIRARGA